MVHDRDSQLAEILAPLSVEQFATDCFGAKPAHLRGSPARAAEVMSWTKLCELLNLTSLWTPDRLVLYMDRQRVPVAQYCQVYDEGGRGVQRPAPRLVGEWVDRGASVIVNDAGTLTSGLRSWVSCLAWALGGNVQVNLYASRAGHQAFPPHFDTHDVFALHCEGEKVWRIYDLRADHPINHPTFKNVTAPADVDKYLDQEVAVTPGDVVYIPRGTFHDALARSHGSLHVTFGVTRPVGLDLLSVLWARLVAERSFREALPIPSGLQPDNATAFTAHVDKLVDRFAAIAGDPEARKWLRQQLSGFAQQDARVATTTFSGER